MKCKINILLVITILACEVQNCDIETRVKKNTVSSHHHKAPDLKALKKRLGFHEDTYFNFTELATKYGYASEEHTVTTEDGYILTIFRLLSKCNTVKGYPVLLMHGVIDTSDGFITPNPKRAIGYILSRKCYDVWVLNNRGNVYSRKHVSLHPDHDSEFWNFSFEEVGYYDVPALVDYVLVKTQKKKVFYIGHSQGTTDFFVMNTLRPEYNEKVQLSILIAPVAWMGNLRSPILRIASILEKELVKLLRTFNINDLAPKNGLIPHQLLEFLCQIIPLEVCGTLGYLVVGDIIGVIPAKTIKMMYGHVFAGVSVKTMRHFAQLVTSRRFQRFDNGREENVAKYGSARPPMYNVSLVTAPAVLICAKNDWLSDLRDVDILKSKLPNLVENYIVADPKWSHNAHLWGNRAPENDFYKIIQYLDEYSDR